MSLAGGEQRAPEPACRECAHWALGPGAGREMASSPGMGEFGSKMQVRASAGALAGKQQVTAREGAAMQWDLRTGELDRWGKGKSGWKGASGVPNTALSTCTADYLSAL